MNLKIIAEKANVSEEDLLKAVDRFLSMLSDEELTMFVSEMSCGGCGCGKKSCK